MNQEQNKPAKNKIELTQTHFRGEIFSSNYPPPEMMEKYARIDPGFPDRLLAMAEKEGNHRRRIESRITNWSIVLDLVGMLFAVGAVAGVLYVGYLFMKNDYPKLGASMIGALTVAIAITFITRGRRGGKNNDPEKKGGLR
jgi:uncharacterized membrane protein